MKNLINFIFLLLFCLTTSKAQHKKDTINLAYKQHFKMNAPLSYLTPPFGDIQFKDKVKTYVLTADVEPHFFLFTESNTSFAFDIFSLIKLRILKENSLPVRTPSFEPGATGYLKCNILKPDNRYDYFTLKYMHHSNGQDGCALNGFDYNSENECIRVSPVQSADKIFNQYNGNFSTNFFEFGYNVSLQSLNDLTKTLPHFLIKHPLTSFKGDRFDYLYIGYQHHFTGIEPALRGRYGLHKLILKYQRITSANWLNSEVEKFEADRFITSISINLSKMKKFENFKAINRLNIDLKYHFTLRFLSTNATSLFVMAGYKGQDDYNIYLEDHFSYVGFGVVAGNIVYSLRK